MQITPAVLQGLQTNLNFIYQKGFESTPTWYEKIAITIPSTTKSNTYAWVDAIPDMREWIGPREVNNLVGNAYQLANKTYELTVGIKRDDIEDDDGSLEMYRSVIVPGFAQKVAKQPDTLIARMLQANTALAYDGLPIFDNAHVLGGQTYDNLFSLVLNANNYDTVYNAMVGYLNNDGSPLLVNPTTLFIAPQLKRTAEEIVGNKDRIVVVQNVAATENVAAATITNAAMGWSNYVIVPEWANTPAMWVLADTSKPLKPVVYQVRRPAKFVARERPDDPMVFDLAEYRYGTDGRWNVGVTLPFLMALGHA